MRKLGTDAELFTSRVLDMADNQSSIIESESSGASLKQQKQQQQQKNDTLLIPPRKKSSKGEMTIVHETLHEVDEEEAINHHQPSTRSSSIPCEPSYIRANKKRTNGNVVLRRKRSVPNMGTHSGPLFTEEETTKNNKGNKRSNSFKYYSTGYFLNDIKIPGFNTSPVEDCPPDVFLPDNNDASNRKSNNKDEKKSKKKTRGLRRTLSMPIFQKQIKGNKSTLRRFGFGK